MARAISVCRDPESLAGRMAMNRLRPRRLTRPSGYRWISAGLCPSTPCNWFQLTRSTILHQATDFRCGFALRSRRIRDFITSRKSPTTHTMISLNPGDNLVTLPTGRQRGRYVRVIATRLLDSGESGRYSLALAELQVFSDGQNVALGKATSALDVQNEPRAPWHIGAFPDGPVWGLDYLVDGYSSRNRLTDLGAPLQALSTRGRLVRELADLDARYTAVRNEAAALIVEWGVTLTLALGGGLAGYVWWSQNRRKILIRELRRRIARDLHDDIGSSLGCIRLTSQIAQTVSGRADIHPGGPRNHRACRW